MSLPTLIYVNTIYGTVPRLVYPKEEQIVVKGAVDDRYYEFPDGSKIPTITDSIELTKEEYDIKVERLKNL